MGRSTSMRVVARCLLAAVAGGLLLGAVVGACSSASSAGGATELRVLACTSYLADITKNVAGTRLQVDTLLPWEVDPHSFEPTPRDAGRVSSSRVVILDTFGLAPLVDELITAATEPGQLVIEAAAGLSARAPQEGEAGPDDAHDEPGASDESQRGDIDPHFWLDPLNVITYVANIRDGLSSVDPAGEETYRRNTDSYVARLRELDTWIKGQVDLIPTDHRLLVSNHRSLGYFADRYGFKIVGTVFPTSSTEGTPSPKELAELIDDIRASGAPAIFLETGANADLANQVAREAGVKVVTDLYTHSLGERAPSYLEMMRWNVRRIVEALR